MEAMIEWVEMVVDYCGSFFNFQMVLIALFGIAFFTVWFLISLVITLIEYTEGDCDSCEHEKSYVCRYCCRKHSEQIRDFYVEKTDDVF